MPDSVRPVTERDSPWRAEGAQHSARLRTRREGKALLAWDQLRHFHKHPKVIAAWLKLFGPGLRWLTPARRRLLLGLAAVLVAVRIPWKDLTQEKHWPEVTPPDMAGLAAVTLVLFGWVWLCHRAARKFSLLPAWMRRHPQICVHAGLWLVLAILWTTSPVHSTLRTVLIGCAFVMPFLVWRVGYMMLAAQRGRMAGTRFVDHLFYIYPAWGTGSDTPYGKGWDYLSANEAKDEESLARSQLAGLKLFLLGALWSVCSDLLSGLVLGKENIYRQVLGGLSPALPTVSAMFARPADYALWQCWVALYLDLFDRVLGLAAKGHIVIGWVRIFGFNVFRNTYKPLLAETIVEFWNRYYYYFKELLVNFFFFPTFTRYFKQQPRWRIFAAVFMAAFVGNVYYHWLGLESTLASGSFREMWALLQSRLFYCALLALGIYISMRREQGKTGKRQARSWPRRAAAIFGVWTFFSIIHIWAHKGRTPFVDRLKFFLGLLGFD